MILGVCFTTIICQAANSKAEHSALHVVRCRGSLNSVWFSYTGSCPVNFLLSP